MNKSTIIEKATPLQMKSFSIGALVVFFFEEQEKQVERAMSGYKELLKLS